MADTDPLFLAQELLAAVGSVLSPRPGLIMPPLAGEVVWEDDAECCGQLAVTMSRIYPLAAEFGFPVQATQPRPCPSGLAVALTVWVIRCWPAGDEGEAPDEQLLTDAGAQVYRDAAGVANGMLNQVETWGERYLSSLMTDVLPAGPQGGLIGVSGTVTVELFRGS